jgi:hypothetical protein
MYLLASQTKQCGHFIYMQHLAIPSINLQAALMLHYIEQRAASSEQMGWMRKDGRC